MEMENRPPDMLSVMETGCFLSPYLIIFEKRLLKMRFSIVLSLSRATEAGVGQKSAEKPASRMKSAFSSN